MSINYIKVGDVADVPSTLTVSGRLWLDTDWLPIATAPKDGTYVLLGKANYGQIVGFWNGDAWDDGDYNSRMNWATHWMPLPPNPPPQLTTGD